MNYNTTVPLRSHLHISHLQNPRRKCREGGQQENLPWFGEFENSVFVFQSDSLCHSWSI